LPATLFEAGCVFAMRGFIDRRRRYIDALQDVSREGAFIEAMDSTRKIVAVRMRPMRGMSCLRGHGWRSGSNR
jgi:hypothetical protein